MGGQSCGQELNSSDKHSKEMRNHPLDVYRMGKGGIESGPTYGFWFPIIKRHSKLLKIKVENLNMVLKKVVEDRHIH